MNRLLKVGILTYHRAHNYGAYLQACALCNRLNEEEFITAEIIDYRMCVEKKVYTWKPNIKYFLKNPFSYRFYKKLDRVFESAINDKIIIKSKDNMISDSIKEFSEFVNNKYDIIVVGSDEVWKLDGFRGFPTPYWLFKDLGCRKFSYAASSRSNINVLSVSQVEILKKAIEDFEFIGVRDKKTFDTLYNLNDSLPLHLCCDPTFLYDFKLPDRDIYDLLKEKTSRIDNNKKIITVMTEDKKVSSYIQRKLGNKYNLISVFHWNFGYINIPEISPFEWMELISKSFFVLTSYFHATCFSIINSTPFLSFGTEIKSSKLIELLNKFGLDDRYINSIESIQIDDLIAEKLSMTDVKNIIIEERKKFSDEFIHSLLCGRDKDEQ